MSYRSESSVARNLDELKRMERAREAAEEKALRAAAARAEQQAQIAREAAANEAQAREAEERAQRDVRDREQQEREDARRAALLRARLEVETAGRIEQERLALAHAQQLRAIDAEARARRGIRAWQFAMAVTLATGGMTYSLHIAPALADAEAQRQAAVTLAMRRDGDRARLQMKTLELERRIMQAAQQNGDAPSREGEDARVAPRRRAEQRPEAKRASVPDAARSPGTRPRHGTQTMVDDPLGDLDLEGDDPLDGMTTPTRSPRRAR